MATPHFLNVDLDIRAHADLQPLVEHWRDQLCQLGSGIDTDPFFVTLECSEGYKNAADTIRQFCEAVESLPPHLLHFWQQCPARILDIGYDSGSERPVLQENLPAELLARVARHFTELKVTIYPI